MRKKEQKEEETKKKPSPLGPPLVVVVNNGDRFFRVCMRNTRKVEARVDCLRTKDLHKRQETQPTNIKSEQQTKIAAEKRSHANCDWIRSTAVWLKVSKNSAVCL